MTEDGTAIKNNSATEKRTPESDKTIREKKSKKIKNVKKKEKKRKEKKKSTAS